MTIGLGSKASLLLDFEDTFGEDPTTPAGVLLPVNYPIQLTAGQAKNKPNRVTGTRNPRKPFPGNFDVTGQITGPLDYTAFWYWLKLMFGAPTTTGVGPYVHEFKIGDTMPSAVMEKRIANLTKSFKYNGVTAGSFSIRIGGDGEQTFSLQLVGKDETPLTTYYMASPTQIVENPFYFSEASVKEGGAAFASMVEMSLDVNFGIDTSYRPIGAGGKIAAAGYGDISITGSYKAAYEDNTLVDKGANNTETSLEATFTSGTNILDILLPEVEYERVGVPVESGMFVFQDVKFHGFYANHAEASAVIMTLTNGDAHA